jgi:1-deoxyxylulose-5-phosphate synthase
MKSVNRRDFLRTGASAVALSAAVSAWGKPENAGPGATDIRTLGKTGITCSWLGIGTGIRGRGPGITDLTLKLTGQEYIGLLEYAYAQGITYFDLADRYGSHHYMREAMRRSIPRDKVMLLSKVWSREPGEMKKDLERFRKELDTDTIDIVLMHCLRGGEENWPETLKPLMDILADAKAKGWIRAHGVSCHNMAAFEKAAGEDWCDVVLARINPFGVHMDGPVDKVAAELKKIHDAGKGVLGMKILGEGDRKCVSNMDQSLQFAADLGTIDAMTIGFMSKAELDEVMAKINAFRRG